MRGRPSRPHISPPRSIETTSLKSAPGPVIRVQISPLNLVGLASLAGPLLLGPYSGSVDNIKPIVSRGRSRPGPIPDLAGRSPGGRRPSPPARRTRRRCPRHSHRHMRVAVLRGAIAPEGRGDLLGLPLVGLLDLDDDTDAIGDGRDESRSAGAGVRNSATSPPALLVMGGPYAPRVRDYRTRASARDRLTCTRVPMDDSPVF